MLDPPQHRWFCSELPHTRAATSPKQRSFVIIHIIGGYSCLVPSGIIASSNEPTSANCSSVTFAPPRSAPPRLARCRSAPIRSSVPRDAIAPITGSRTVIGAMASRGTEDLIFFSNGGNRLPSPQSGFQADGLLEFIPPLFSIKLRLDSPVPIRTARPDAIIGLWLALSTLLGLLALKRSC